MPKLILTDEHFAGQVYELTLGKTTVGRGAYNTLALHDPSVLLTHCEILVQGPEVERSGSWIGHHEQELRYA